MEQSDYFADKAASASETDRLNRLAGIYDPLAQQALTEAGLVAGMQVAEVGVGSGTMLRWLSDQVGSGGQVHGFDLTDRFLPADWQSNSAVSVHQHDIASAELPAAQFDLIYSRLLLEHLSEPVRAIRHMVSGLRPGGCLVALDFDSSVVAAVDSSHPLAADFDRAARHIHQAVNASGVMCCDYGRQVADDFRRAGLVNVRQHMVPRLEVGGSDTAQVSVDGMALLALADSALAEPITIASAAMRTPGFEYRDVDMVCCRGTKPAK